MKFAISPEDKLALVLSLVPHTVQGAERQDTRLVAWDELGSLRPFARLVAQRIQKGQGNPSFSAEELAPFAGTDLEVVELQPLTVQFLIDEIGAGVPGVFVDRLTEMRHDLKRVLDKTYELPPELH